MFFLSCWLSSERIAHRVTVDDLSHAYNYFIQYNITCIGLYNENGSLLMLHHINWAGLYNNMPYQLKVINLFNAGNFKTMKTQDKLLSFK